MIDRSLKIFTIVKTIVKFERNGNQKKQTEAELKILVNFEEEKITFKKVETAFVK